jgi:hypothetical protein
MRQPSWRRRARGQREASEVVSPRRSCHPVEHPLTRLSLAFGADCVAPCWPVEPGVDGKQKNDFAHEAAAAERVRHVTPREPDECLRRRMICARSSSTPARPYICRRTGFSRLMWASTAPAVAIHRCRVWTVPTRKIVRKRNIRRRIVANPGQCRFNAGSRRLASIFLLARSPGTTRDRQRSRESVVAGCSKRWVGGRVSTHSARDAL